MDVKQIPLVVHEMTEARHLQLLTAIIAGWAASIIALAMAKRK